MDKLVCCCVKDLQELTRACVTDTLYWALECYNAEAEKVNIVVHQHNQSLLQQYEAGQLTKRKSK